MKIKESEEVVELIREVDNCLKLSWWERRFINSLSINVLGTGGYPWDFDLRTLYPNEHTQLVKLWGKCR